MRLTCALTLAVALAACSPTGRSDDTDASAARAAIDANNANWARLSAAGHADSIGRFYHATAVLLPPNMAPVRGHEAIHQFFGMLSTMSSPPPVLAIRAESVWVAGDNAFELGRWTFVWPAGATRPPGAPAADSGKYMARSVKHNGTWQTVENIWNSDLPMPAPEPKPAPRR